VIVSQLFCKMPALRRLKWKIWCKLWRKRQRRFTFYQALIAFQERNNFKILSKASQKKKKLYRKRLNFMYNQQLKLLLKKFERAKNQIIKFQLKYGVYDE